jgi:hypothetical protein
MPGKEKRMLSGGIGGFGIMSCTYTEGSLSVHDILNWVKNDLAPRMTPFPGPRSVAIFDNMPEHRKLQEPIERAIAAYGGIVIWNPPQSPDLNLIEKLWDNVLAHCNRCIFELLAAGAHRTFGLGDLLSALSNARLGVHAFEHLFDL